MKNRDGLAVEIVRVRLKLEEEWECNVFSLLEKLERKGKRNFELYSTGGNSWMDGWRKVRKAFGAATVEIGGQVMKLSKSRSYVEQGKTVHVKYLRKWKPRSGPDKKRLVALLRNPRRIQQVESANVDTMFRLNKAAKDFQQNSTRSYLRRIIGRTIKQQTGWVMGAHLTVKVKYDDRVKLAEIDLEHTYVYATGVLLQQVVGIPMGKSTSPPLACILCAYSEYRFLSNLGSLKRKVRGLRLMDDVSLIIDVGMKRDTRREAKIRMEFEACYPNNLTLKRTDEGTGVWDFLGLEMRTYIAAPYVGSIQVSKNEKSVWENETLEFKTGQYYQSWGSKQQKSAVVASYLHRIDINTTIRCEIPWRVLTLSRELRLKDFPEEFMKRTIKCFCTGREEIWKLTRDWICGT
ncbi:hypothetical protein CBR_g28917 [Chara braunii]|uniref:Reverse transcriptase domain-containing protein n=1 Tax=Chara braunii TaxID=69332 RepID=A0A388LA66_CHABU|nr:hypothetical protein CBR_g28917 [Chara braunii]|eukprot:GBG79200.1 hypothetical protein CBR_g28917 [Chara braunii]